MTDSRNSSGPTTRPCAATRFAALPPTSPRTSWPRPSWSPGAGWKLSPDDALPWLYGVARRVLANERRSADRRTALEERVANSTVTGGGDAADRLGDAELMRTALAGLSENHREALTLVAWHGLTGARAARAAGCSPATFAVRLHRARGKLAAQLALLEQAPAPLEVTSCET